MNLNKKLLFHLHNFYGKKVNYYLEMGEGASRAKKTRRLLARPI